MNAPRAVGKLLLTGVPGWLTAALLDDLPRAPLAGLSGVRCMVERGAAVDRAPGCGSNVSDWEIVEGDLRDADSLRRAVRGVDTVLHAAGVVHVRRTRDWYRINTDGTESLARSAAEAGVERFVFVSSNAAAGRAPTRDHLLTEAEPAQPLSHYGRSKWLAEKAVLALADRMPAVVLRPCMFYGPPVPTRHVEVYRRILSGRMPLVGGGEFARSLSHIDNLVQGCRLAMTHPAAPGETYYITDRPVYTTRQIVVAMAEALGVSPRWLPLPRLVGPTAYAADRVLAAVGAYWQTLHLVGESDWHVGVSCEKACRELGYQPTMSLNEGMRQAVAWCVAQGLLPPRHARG